MFFFILFHLVLLETKEIQAIDISGNDILEFQSLIPKAIPSQSNVEEDMLSNMTKLICFYTFTNQFKPDIMKDLCTHINVGFFSISKQNFSLYTSTENLQLLSDVMLLKKSNKHLKIIITVGGAGDGNFSPMVANHTSRKMFIRSLMEVLKKYKIDGIDLDWEWPVVDGNPKEKVKLIQLLYEIRKEFDRHKKKYILSIDVPALKPLVELGFYIHYIAEYVDHVNVMCYDYHFYSALFPLTGHNAPLYSPPSGFFKTFNTNYSISYWISNSMPREKIVLGLPTYGHTFKLSVPNKHALYAPAAGFGSVGHSGFANYQQICDFLTHKNVTIVYDEVSKVSYAYLFPEWVSFDDEKSLAEKADYVLKEKLSGVMVFSVNSDDYLGVCTENKTKLPLIRKIRSILFNEV